MKFSERYGYVKPSNVLKRGNLDKEGATALCNCFDHLEKWLNNYDVERYNHYDETYTQMEETIWCFFLNQRRNDFYGFNSHKVVATKYLLSDNIEWYLKYDLIEFALRYLKPRNKNDRSYNEIYATFIELINATFKRLNYAYRIVGEEIVEIPDSEEITAIEETLKETSTVGTHMSEALKQLAERPSPNYRNSIKESISAVEALCREITGANTLGEALKRLEKNGVLIPTFLKSGFEKLYVYTNDERTGIRHALMDDVETPDYDEAKFMLVACCAFINYVQSKRSK